MQELSERLGISDILRQVQDELVSAEKQRRTKAIPSLFETESCEIEVKFVVKKSVAAGGKIDLQLVAVNLGDEIANEVVHSVRVRFKVLPDDVSHAPLKELERPTGLRPRKD